MTHHVEIDQYLEALRDDLPSAKEEAKLHRKLAAAGLCLTVTLASKTATAGSVIAVNSGLFATISARFASLPLMAQLSLVTATTATVAAIPVVVATTGHHQVAPTHQTEPRVVERQSPSAAMRARAPQAKARDAETAISEEPALASTDPTETRAQAPVTASRRKAQVITPSSVESSTLAQETALIDAALQAIRERSFARAEQLIAQHSRQFPNGHLSLERQRAREKLNEAKSHSQ